MLSLLTLNRYMPAELNIYGIMLTHKTFRLFEFFVYKKSIITRAKNILKVSDKNTAVMYFI